MDKDIRRLERLASTGDVEAKNQLERLKKRIGEPKPKPAYDPGLNTRDIELEDLRVAEDGEVYEFEGMMVEVHYEVDGEDVSETYWDQGDRARWLVYHVVLSDQDQIDAYNEEALREGFTPMPFKEGEDIYSLLSDSQKSSIESQVESIDREPDYYFDEPSDYYDDYDGGW